MSNEAAVESEIQSKGLNAPRLTPAKIDATIVAEDYHVFAGCPGEGPRTTVCLLTLRNGFQVVGESSCAHHLNFDAELGKKISRENARGKIWALEGYLLKQNLYQSQNPESPE